MAGRRPADPASVMSIDPPPAGSRPTQADGRLGAGLGLAGSLGLHALLVYGLVGLPATPAPDRPPEPARVIELALLPPDVPDAPEAPQRAPEAQAKPAAEAPAPAAIDAEPVLAIADAAEAPRPLAPPQPPAQAASMPAPPPPTAEEWAFASRYTLKNGKAYRHSWGQQVRSMMGTAVEGPDQGMVRFRVEIAPDGRLLRLDTLWSTSPVAERLAREAIARMPGWPAPPAGQPLVFEKTLAFTPHATDGPPVYKDDCLPDPPVFRNPFAWDGQSPPVRAAARPVEPPDPQALADCLKQLPQDSVEAEAAQDQRLMDQWGWSQRKPGP